MFLEKIFETPNVKNAVGRQYCEFSTKLVHNTTYAGTAPIRNSIRQSRFGSWGFELGPRGFPGVSGDHKKGVLETF